MRLKIEYLYQQYYVSLSEDMRILTKCA